MSCIGFASLHISIPADSIPYAGKVGCGLSTVRDLAGLRDEVIRIFKSSPVRGWLPLGHQAVVCQAGWDLCDVAKKSRAMYCAHVGALVPITEVLLYRIAHVRSTTPLEGRVLELCEGKPLFGEPPRTCLLCQDPIARKEPFYSISDEYGEATYCTKCQSRMMELATHYKDQRWSFHRFGEK